MKLAQRAAALCLSALLLLTPALAAESSLSAQARQQDLDYLYDTLKRKHPDFFANTPEQEFEAKKAEIESRLDTASDLEFVFDLSSLVALAKDSHTNVGLRLSEDMHLYPFSLKWFDQEGWVLATAPKAHQDKLGLTVTALNGHSMDEVSGRFATMISADNPVKLRRQVRQMLYVQEILAYLDLVEDGDPLTFTLSDGKGAESTLTMNALTQAEFGELELAYLSDQRKSVPDTAPANRYYFSLSLDASTYYIQYNRCMEDPELPMEDFARQVAADLEGGAYTQVILDLRNNGGGSDGVLVPILMLLTPRVQDGSLRLWGLIDEATFSSAVINSVMIQEMGGYLVGSPASGSVNHFGAVNGFELPNSGLSVSHSTKMIDLSQLLAAAQGAGIEALQPDVPAPTTLADYLAGKDTAVEYVLANGADFEAPDRGGRPLTRSHFVYQLYQAARAAGKDVSAAGTSFQDMIPVAYFAPAVNWAEANGIAQGYGAQSFGVSRVLTRAEAAVFLSRFAAYLGLEIPGQDMAFTDAASIPAWAADAARQAAGLGLMSGGETAFRPSQTLTRAEGEALVRALAD